jgi:phage N-6-adenine-methyltransferase
MQILTRKKSGASFRRGKSKQDYKTPQDFRFAVMSRFNYGVLPAFDLAADATNYFSTGNYFCAASEALNHEWHKITGLLWLNPPFDKITPWAKKCAEEAKLGADILFLVPAAVGSNWFRDYVHKKAFVEFLNGRIHFDPEHPTWGYPKDTMLARYWNGISGYDVWNWRQ